MTAARGLRWHLFQLLLLAILPIGLFAAALLFLHWKAQEEQRARIQIESARMAAAAVDNAIDSTIQRLRILARLWAAEPGASAEFHEHARTALTGSPDWENVLAFTASGQPMFRADRPFGASIPGMVMRGYVTRALRENRPMVSELFTSTVRNAKVVGVAVPVVRQGRVTHVLIASLRLRWFDELLSRQGLPPGGVAVIVDGNRNIVSRSRDGDLRRGSAPAERLRTNLKNAAEGFGRSVSLDGDHVYSAWTPTRHGWAVAIAAPAAPVDGALFRHLALLGGGWVVVILASLAFAALKGKKIALALRQLQERAGALTPGARDRAPGAGNVKLRLRPPRPSVRAEMAEIEQVHAALDRTAVQLDEARRERDRAFATEREARAAAEAANRAKDEFLAMLGHELRNPLAAIANAGAILDSKRSTPAQLEFAASIINRQTGHLKRLIDDLLDVGRVMNGKIRLERRPTDLRASLEQVVATLNTAGVLAPHEVSVQAEPVSVHGDPTRLEQIMTNLLVNAATYTPAPGRIAVRLAQEQGEAVLTVRDNGIGIPAESLGRLFELFFQGGEPRAHRAHSGLGIGLTLVKRLAELHGGSVTAQSAGRGAGATFTVRLPAIAHRPAALRLVGGTEVLGPPHTVLIVEDDADERETLRMALELRGHRVLQAADGSAALQEMRSSRPDMALIDIGLPGMDGYSLARHIRSEYDGSVALVALTGYGSEEDAKRAREAGFAAHLAKPVDPRVLFSVVGRS